MNSVKISVYTHIRSLSCPKEEQENLSTNSTAIALPTIWGSTSSFCQNFLWALWLRSRFVWVQRLRYRWVESRAEDIHCFYSLNLSEQLGFGKERVRDAVRVLSSPLCVGLSYMLCDFIQCILMALGECSGSTPSRHTDGIPGNLFREMQESKIHIHPPWALGTVWEMDADSFCQKKPSRWNAQHELPSASLFIDYNLIM